jgi:hypothetical protein
MQSFLCHPTALRTRIDTPWSLGRTRFLYFGFILSLKLGLHVCICISLLGGPCQPCRWCTESWKGQLDQPIQCTSSDANNGREFTNRESAIAAALRLSHHEGEAFNELSSTMWIGDAEGRSIPTASNIFVIIWHTGFGG